jgi:hypothetical protein
VRNLSKKQVKYKKKASFSFHFRARVPYVKAHKFRFNEKKTDNVKQPFQ